MPYAGMTRTIGVVILDKSGVHMDNIRAFMLRNRLDKETVAYYYKNLLNWRCKKPGFSAMPTLAHGGLRVEARDEFALSWLATTIRNLPGLWMGSEGYEIVLENELNKYYTGVVIVPDLEGDQEYIRDFLFFFNDHLKINTWPIFAHRVQRVRNAKNHLMVFGIPVDEIQALERNKCRLYYKMATVCVLVKKSRTRDFQIPVVAPATYTSRVEGYGATGDPGFDIRELELSQEEKVMLLGDSGDILCLSLLLPAPYCM